MKDRELLTETSKRDQAVSWLLEQENPGVRYWAFRELLQRPEDDLETTASQHSLASWSPVLDLLKQQNPNGYWEEPEDVYWPKWTATVWQLILLGELGFSRRHPAIKAGCEHFLKVMDSQDRSWPPPDYSDKDAEGQWLGWRSVWEPCVTGNMARTLTLFGYQDDSRVREMYEWLVKYQLPDGGWNCEPGPWGKEVHHSSFMSTIEPLWAFSELDPQNWPKGAREAVARGAEFMLMHKLYKSDKTGKIINEEWTKLHFPLFYFYDILHGLRILSKLGFASDERINDAVKLLKSKQLPDGSWPLESTFLNSLGRNLVKDSKTGWTIVEERGKARIPAIYQVLGRVGEPNAWVTLNALRALKGVG